MEEFRLHVLRKLYRRRCIGAKHTAIEVAYSGVAKHSQFAAKYATAQLIREGFILLKKTEYGDQVSLNPDRLSEIKDILEEE